MDSSHLQEFYNIAEKILSFEDIDEALLHRLVEVIEVKEEGNVAIHYKFMSPASIVV